MLLDDIKTVLGIDDESKDGLLTIYVNRSKVLIKHYLNTDDTIDAESLYPEAILELVVFNYNRRGNENIKQFSQGSHSGTYGDDIPQSIKSLLPLPSIRMR